MRVRLTSDIAVKAGGRTHPPGATIVCDDVTARTIVGAGLGHVLSEPAPAAPEPARPAAQKGGKRGRRTNGG